MWQAGYACNDVHASRGRCTVDASVIARLKDASEKRFQMFVFQRKQRQNSPSTATPASFQFYFRAVPPAATLRLRRCGSMPTLERSASPSRSRRLMLPQQGSPRTIPDGRIVHPVYSCDPASPTCDDNATAQRLIASNHGEPVESCRTSTLARSFAARPNLRSSISTIIILR